MSEETHPGDGEGPDTKADSRTQRGFARPKVGRDGVDVDEAIPKGPSRSRGPEESGELYLPPGTVPARSLHDDTPLVEIEVVHLSGTAPRMAQPTQTVEVWTQNRIYTMDASLNCVSVCARADMKPDPSHPFIGFRLVGGQHREGETFEISYPYPRPGTEAVFEHPAGSRGNFSRTSTVTRVLLRLHVVTVRPSVLVPTWSEVTQSERPKR